MHASSLENMRKCHDRYVTEDFWADRETAIVLDLGGADVNGSYREAFSGSRYTYVGADMAEAPGVQLVLTDPYAIPLPDGSVDLVLSGQMFEHCEFFWLAFAEMMRVVKPDGYVFLIAPSAGPIHRYPVDCYRFYPDAYRALAKYTGCQLVDVWLDERGPWNDLVGVFQKHFRIPAAQPQDEDTVPDGFDPSGGARIPKGSAEEEMTQGSLPYLDAMALVHRIVAPELYLEIGVRHGASLALAHGRAIGVDPHPEIDVDLPATAQLFDITSDGFFETKADAALDRAPDLVFIDGMHLFENVLRDFMQVERRAHPATVVVIDDVFPNNPRQALRKRATKVWAGDVWKIFTSLQKYRPDLILLPLDTAPTGLLLVLGLDPGNTTLWSRYNTLVSRLVRDAQPEPPRDCLDRTGAIDPASPLVEQVLAEITGLRRQNAGVRAVGKRLKRLLAPAKENPESR